MTGSFADALAGWHEFYAVLATAATTVMAALFVVASIASSFLTPERAGETRFFLTATVIHLAAAFFASALVLVPTLDATGLGLLLGALALAGLAFAAAAGWNIARRGPELERIDRLWYGLLPVVGYGVLVAAAALALGRNPRALDTLAGALMILVAAGIRNAWDLLLFFIIKTKR